MAEPIKRTAVRALLVTPARDVLLMRIADRDRTWWITPGGGLEPGEAPADGLLREVWEETGMRLATPGPLVWTRRKTSRGLSTGDLYDSTELIYLCAVDRSEPTFDGWTDEERDVVRDVRWWTLDELAVTDEVVYPTRLATLLRDLLDNGPPPDPIDTGD